MGEKLEYWGTSCLVWMEQRAKERLKGRLDKAWSSIKFEEQYDMGCARGRERITLAFQNTVPEADQEVVLPSCIVSQVLCCIY